MNYFMFTPHCRLTLTHHHSPKLTVGLDVTITLSSFTCLAGTGVSAKCCRSERKQTLLWPSHGRQRLLLFFGLPGPLRSDISCDTMTYFFSQPITSRKLYFQVEPVTLLSKLKGLHGALSRRVESGPLHQHNRHLVASPLSFRRSKMQGTQIRPAAEPLSIVC